MKWSGMVPAPQEVRLTLLESATSSAAAWSAFIAIHPIHPHSAFHHRLAVAAHLTSHARHAIPNLALFWREKLAHCNTVSRFLLGHVGLQLADFVDLAVDCADCGIGCKTARSTRSA